MSILLRDLNVVTNPSAGQIDAYGRVRVSSIYTMLESEQTFDNEPLLWYNVTPTGTSITYNSNRSSNILQIDSLTSETVRRQTKMFFKYASGKSQLFGWTANMDPVGSGTVGITKRAGGFTDNDGVFFEYENGIMYVVRRSSISGSPVDQRIPQSEWNVDRGDGTGQSRITIDWSKMHIFEIVYQWQGSGIIRYQLRFNGRVLILHEIGASNLLENVWCSNPNFPARVEIVGNGINESSSLELACFCVQQEANGNQSAHIHQSIARDLALTTGGDTNVYVLAAIRLKNNYNGARVKVLSSQVFSITTNANYYYALVRDPIITSGSYTWTDKPNSACQIHNTTNAPQVSLFSGFVEYSGYNSQSRGSGDPGTVLLADQNILALGFNDNVPEVVALVVRNLDATSKDYYGAINWIEQ